MSADDCYCDFCRPLTDREAAAEMRINRVRQRLRDEESISIGVMWLARERFMDGGSQLAYHYAIGQFTGARCALEQFEEEMAR